MNLNQIGQGFLDSVNTGPEDYRKTQHLARNLSGQEEEAPMLETYLGTHPVSLGAREATKTSDKNMAEARRRRGDSLSSKGDVAFGQQLGNLANDILFDKTRNFWWLINAPQALASVIQDSAVKHEIFGNPDLYKREEIKDKNGKPYKKIKTDDLGQIIENEAYQRAINYKDPNRVHQGIVDRETGSLRKGYEINPQGNYTTKKYGSAGVQALSIPTTIAINAGLGLLNPIGGSGGYTAALPSEDDPTKTSNVIGEVAAKYFLGRTGDLLPYDEFSKVRPDVSRDEYNRYKAFKYDKGLDLNITDGDFTIPTGVLKGTMDGIHGPEVQFLGRSLPLLTTILPTATTIAGTALGARLSRGKPANKRTAIRDGIIGGMTGLVGGSAAGLIAEQARRRAGSVSSNELTGEQE